MIDTDSPSKNSNWFVRNRGILMACTLAFVPGLLITHSLTKTLVYLGILAVTLVVLRDDGLTVSLGFGETPAEDDPIPEYLREVVPTPTGEAATTPASANT